MGTKQIISYIIYIIIDVKHNTYCNLLSEMQMSNKTSCRGFR